MPYTDPVTTHSTLFKQLHNKPYNNIIIVDFADLKSNFRCDLKAKTNVKSTSVKDVSINKQKSVRR